MKDSEFLQQVWANLSESKVTTYLGAALVLATVLCDSGVVALYLSKPAEHAWCLAFSKLAGYVGGGALMVSRGPWTK